MKLGGQNKPLVIGSGSGPVTEHNKLKGLSYEESGHTGFQKAEEGKGLSTNDFTDAEKEKLENLNGAYVFMGSLVNMPDIPYPGALPHDITPVYNYIGSDVEFTQPYANGQPYLINSLGVSYLPWGEEGFMHASFFVTQNEGIIFYEGLDVDVTIGDDANNVLGTGSHKVVGVESAQLDTGEFVVRVILDALSLPANVLWVQCSPKINIRKGDNVAVFAVAGRVFWEVLSHDYGEEIKELKEQISTGGGSVDLSGYATTEYVDGLIGDIATELDEVIELQDDWINSVEATLPVEPDNGEVEEI